MLAVWQIVPKHIMIIHNLMHVTMDLVYPGLNQMLNNYMCKAKKQWVHHHYLDIQSKHTGTYCFFGCICPNYTLDFGA